MIPRSSAFALPLFLLAPGLAAQSSVHVVDANGGPGVDFLEVQDAVSAASPGDCVLVHTGTYGAVLIDRALTVAAAAGASPVVERIEVTGVDAPARLVVRGIETNSPGNGLWVHDASGELWFEDCRLRGTHDQSIVGEDRRGVFLQPGAQAVFLRCEIEGGDGLTAIFVVAAAEGLVAVDADVHLVESTVLGGIRAPVGHTTALGEPGAVVDGGSFFASGSEIRGRDGADGACGIFGPDVGPGYGGHGLVLQGDATAFALDTSVEGGEGGDPATGCTQFAPGADGVPLFVEAGQYQVLAGSARSLVAASPVVEGEAVDLTYAGEPGDLVFLVASVESLSTLLLPLKGTQLVAEPFVVLPMGSADGAGSLATSLPIALLGGGAEFFEMFAQPAVVAPGRVVLGGGSTLAIVSATL